MTRPATLSEVADRVRSGVALERTLPEFCDTFYSSPDDGARAAMLAKEPAITGDARTDALLGGVCEYLAKQNKLESVPRWAYGPTRSLDMPWHTTPPGADTDGMREFLTFSSPAEFSHRNIFTESQPLRRARLRTA